VPIRIDDPGQLLTQHLGKTASANLLLGVSSDAFMFHPAPVVSKDPNGRAHHIVIPFDASVNLSVTSGFFKFADAAGQEVGRTGTAIIPIKVPAGQQPTTVRLVVTATKR